MVEVAVFGMGCFWRAQAVFDGLRGVVSTRVGYAGGTGEVRYREAEEEGYAEVVEVKFDLKKISYRELLDVFWREHDPTSKNRQGLDVGERYRSVIFYGDDSQRKKAEVSRKRLDRKLKEKGFFSRLLGKGKTVTEIVPLIKFYEAEREHQDYYKKHGKTC
jgi:peptide-methionine (S)-S-oxide reductase